MPNAVVGTLVFLGAETMLFGGLVSVLIVLRAGAPTWPPADQPRLPILITAINTIVLIGSAFSMARAANGARRGHARELRRWLIVTALGGVTFLVVQGTEWLRLLHYGLSATATTYGGTFYTLIGVHAVHVLGGVAVLLAVLRESLRGRYSTRTYGPVEACRLYWSFVVAVWPVLYVLVYAI